VIEDVIKREREKMAAEGAFMLLRREMRDEYIMERPLDRIL
jgi:hypothetical protein